MLQRKVGTRPLVAALAAVFLLWVMVAGAFGALLAVAGRNDSFNLVEWEVTRLITFGVNRSASLVGAGTASDAEVKRYFDLLAQARAARRRQAIATANGGSVTAAGDDAPLLAQAAILRVRVEARFEQAIRDAAAQAGLMQSLLGFAGVRVVWPPVATGFSVPPHILIVSPRNRISLQDTRLLRIDLSNDAARRIEEQTERGGVSALVDQVGGLGAYPSIADENDSPLGLMQTVAHEWMHDYLAFHPLGARYAQSNDMTLINETVADLVGRELGSAAFESLHMPTVAPAPAAQQQGGVDFNRTMHDLRLEVDALLKAGEIDTAERRMNETQQLLAANGYNIRRINQAYLAFYGSYGSNPASSNPLGTSVQSLRRLSLSLGEFVHRVAQVTSPADLNRLVRDASVAHSHDSERPASEAAAR